MDALVATFKARNPNFLADFKPKFQCQTQAQNSNLLFKGVLRGLPYVNFPLKSTGKNIVSVQRRCSIIYSSLQTAAAAAYTAQRAQPCSKATSAPPCGPAQKRSPARSAACRAQPYRPPLRLFTNCQKILMLENLLISQQSGQAVS